MDDDKRLKALFEQRRALLQKEEDFKKFLRQRDPNGPALQAKTSYIDESLGKPRTNSELESKAMQQAKRDLSTEKYKAQQRERYEKSLKAHDARVQQLKAAQDAKDKQKQDNARSQDKERQQKAAQEADKQAQARTELANKMKTAQGQSAAERKKSFDHAASQASGPKMGGAFRGAAEQEKRQAEQQQANERAMQVQDKQKAIQDNARSMTQRRQQER